MRVTIEGTVTPSADLPRGQRRTVEYTDYIKKLERRGFVKVVEVHEDPKPAPKKRAKKADDVVLAAEDNG